MLQNNGSLVRLNSGMDFKIDGFREEKDNDNKST